MGIETERRTFVVVVTQTVEVTLDASKFTPEFMAEFNSSISDWGDDLEEHAKHLAWVHASGLEDLAAAWREPFVEGYGPIAELGISARTTDTETELSHVQ